MKNLYSKIKEYYWELELVAKNQPIVFWLSTLLIIFLIGNATSLFNTILNYIIPFLGFIGDLIYKHISNGIIDNTPYILYGVIIQLLLLISVLLIYTIDKTYIKITNFLMFLGYTVLILCIIIDTKYVYQSSKIIEFQKEFLKTKTLAPSLKEINLIEYKFSQIKSKEDYDGLLNELKNKN